LKNYSCESESVNFECIHSDKDKVGN